jgi:hypothetical protein
MKSAIEWIWQIAIFGLLQLACLAWSCLPSLASNKLVIPIFYATDRVLNSSYTANIAFTDDQAKPVAVSCGIKNIVLVDQPDISDFDRIHGLGWWNVLPGTDPGKPLVNNTTLNSEQLISQIKKIIDDGPENRPLIVYVNGCCIGFDKSLEDGAKIASSLDAPVLVYAWAAKPPTMEQYRENEIRQRNGAKAFTEFLESLEQGVGSDRIVLLAHSMGNRFLHETLKYRYWNHGSNPAYPKFRAVGFGCADVNVDDFASDEPGIAFNSEHIIVTKNNTDPALLGSQVQRGFYGRLGAPLNALNKLIKTEGADLYGIEGLYFKTHAFPLPIFIDLIRQQEGGYSNKYLFLQEKQHLFRVTK